MQDGHFNPIATTPGAAHGAVPDSTVDVIKVAVVDDHAITRTALRQYIDEQPGMKCVAEADNGRKAIDMVRKTDIDVLLLDLAMPGQGGIDSIAMIRAKAPGLRILILSGYPEDQFALNLIRLGASGYLNKGCEPEEILEAIRSVNRCGRYLSPSVADLLAGQYAGQGGRPPHEHLSEREFQILLKLAKGESSSAIADDLSLSAKTVSTYRTRLIGKMGMVSNSELTYYALKHRLID